MHRYTHASCVYFTSLISTLRSCAMRVRPRERDDKRGNTYFHVVRYTRGSLHRHALRLRRSVYWTRPNILLAHTDTAVTAIRWVFVLKTATTTMKNRQKLTDPNEITTHLLAVTQKGTVYDVCGALQRNVSETTGRSRGDRFPIYTCRSLHYLQLMIFIFVAFTSTRYRHLKNTLDALCLIV